MTRLIVWRHGATVWNAEHRVQGQSDIPLSDAGRAQAAATAPLLAAYQPDLLFSSDLRRAVDTAAALVELTGRSVEYDIRLRERHFGPWEGLTNPEIALRFPAEYARWVAGKPLSDPAIETREDVAKRATAALLDVAGRCQGGTAVVVSHRGAILGGMAGVLGWSDHLLKTLSGLDNCRFAELRHTDLRGWQLVAHNVGAC